MTSSVDLNSNGSVSWRVGTTGLLDIVLTVTAPDGSITTLDAVEDVDAAGTYNATVPGSLPGRYVLNWASATDDLTHSDVLNVFPADPRFMIALAEAKSMLNIPKTKTQDEDDLRVVLAAVTIVLEDIVGPIIAENKTQYAHGGRSAINLWYKPTEIVSVHENGVVLVEEQGYIVWPEAAIIYAGSRTSPGVFAPGQLNICIVYSVGSTNLRPNLRLAASMLLRHLWGIFTSGHNAGHNTDDEMVETPSRYLVPNAVASLCTPEDPLPGIA